MDQFMARDPNAAIRATEAASRRNLQSFGSARLVNAR
jgi:hypothetical protein